MKKLASGFISLIALSSILAGAEQVQPREAAIAASDKGIVKLDVVLGQKVKKGDLLFELDPSIINAKLEWASMDRKSMEPIIKGAEKLIKDKHITADNYELAIYSNNWCDREENLCKAEREASMYYAPFDGTVTKIYRYDGSGLGDNDDEVVVTEGDVKVDTSHQVAMVCSPPWNTVLDLKVELGQQVKKGDVLFTIKSVDILKAQLDMDKDILIKAEKKYNRLKTLHSENATSYFNMLISSFDYTKALTNVKIDEIKIAQSTMYAPFDGTVTKVYRVNGTGMGHGKPVVDITAIN